MRVAPRQRHINFLGKWSHPFGYALFISELHSFNGQRCDLHQRERDLESHQIKVGYENSTRSECLPVCPHIVRKNIYCLR